MVGLFLLSAIYRYTILLQDVLETMPTFHVQLILFKKCLTKASLTTLSQILQTVHVRFTDL